jgi:exodeoxyribonuclease VIII
MSYHEKHDAITKTGLTVFAKSPLEYYHTYITGKLPRKPATQPMLLGTVLHSVLLEDCTLADLVTVYPADCFKSNNTLHPQKSAEFRESLGRCVAVKEQEFEDIATVVESVAPQLADFLKRNDVQREAVFQAANVHGLPAKCKPDAVRIGQDVTVIDLKFGAMIDPQSFSRSAKSFKYWLQDAHYTAVLEAIHGNRFVGFQFVAIETKFPFRVQRYHYDQSSRDSGRAEHKRLMEKLARCHATGDWSDDWDSTLVLNPWDVETNELCEVEV